MADKPSGACSFIPIRDAARSLHRSPRSEGAQKVLTICVKQEHRGSQSQCLGLRAGSVTMSTRLRPHAAPLLSLLLLSEDGCRVGLHVGVGTFPRRAGVLPNSVGDGDTLR